MDKAEHRDLLEIGVDAGVPSRGGGTGGLREGGDAENNLRSASEYAWLI